MSVPSQVPRQGKTQGSVLILVLWVSLGLVALALTFGHSMIMTYRGADNDLAGRQADQAIEGAVRYAEMLMSNVEKPGELPDVASYTSEAVPVGDATFWFLGAPIDDESGTTPVFGLVDEASKLNLNRATAGMLIKLPGMTDELAAAIVDWRDDDDDIQTNGAESETYMLRQPSYEAKNDRFESLQELALVNGVDPFILYGEDTNLNGVLDPNEDDGSKSAPDDNADGRLDSGILQYVTVFSEEPTTKSDGTPRVNVSNPTQPDVGNLLTTTFGQSRRDQIVNNLGTTAITSILEFVIRGQLNAEEEEKIAGDIVVNNAHLIGAVNVNTASETVLACLPGMDADKASTLVATRKQRAQTGTSMAWVVPALGDALALQIGPFITGRSYQVSADVAAVGRHGRGYRRTRFIVDMSTGTPRIIYRRNLGPLGWSLGSEVKQTLALGKETR